MTYQFETERKITHCLDCPCMTMGFRCGIYCKVVDKQLSLTETDRKKPNWCPLVEVESEEV